MKERSSLEPKTPLEKFCQKISGLKEEEIVSGRTAHFEFVNPIDLDERDMEIFGMISDRNHDIDELVSVVQKRRLELSESGNKSQKEFLAYLNHLVQIRMERLRL